MNSFHWGNRPWLPSIAVLKSRSTSPNARVKGRRGYGAFRNRKRDEVTCLLRWVHITIFVLLR